MNPSDYWLREHHQVVGRLFADPDVRGDLLLVGMWLARATILGDPPQGPGGWSITDAARDLFPLRTRPKITGFGQVTGGETNAADVWRVIAVLKADIRRYDAWLDQPGGRHARFTCSAPTPRKPACGKNYTVSAMFTDPATGRKRIVSACGKHMDWWREQDQAQRDALAAVDVPRPAANAGGALARHVSLDWPRLWKTLDPQWTTPPEVEAWERPNLRLLVTSDLSAAPPATRSVPRPRFAVIEGALT